MLDPAEINPPVERKTLLDLASLEKRRHDFLSRKRAVSWSVMRMLQ